MKVDRAALARLLAHRIADDRPWLDHPCLFVGRDVGVAEDMRLRPILDGEREPTEAEATLIAAALGVGLSELLPPGDDRRIERVREQLAAIGSQLAEVAAIYGVSAPWPPDRRARPRSCPACHSIGPPRDGCTSSWHLDNQCPVCGSDDKAFRRGTDGGVPCVSTWHG